MRTSVPLRQAGVPAALLFVASDSEAVLAQLPATLPGGARVSTAAAADGAALAHLGSSKTLQQPTVTHTAVARVVHDWAARRAS